MNINAISNYSNVTKTQSFKAEPQKLYTDFNEIIPEEVSDETVVDYSTWGDNYPVPITAGQRRAAQKEELARIAAKAAVAAAEKEAVKNKKEPTPEEMKEQTIRYLYY